MPWGDCLQEFVPGIPLLGPALERAGGRTLDVVLHELPSPVSDVFTLRADSRNGQRVIARLTVGFTRALLSRVGLRLPTPRLLAEEPHGRIDAAVVLHDLEGGIG